MTIKEVAEKYDISADTLRYYERVGMIPKVTRRPNGIRDYQESDLGWVELAICMRSAGLPIEVMIEYVKLYKEGDNTILKEQKAQIESTVERLAYKISKYEEAMETGVLVWDESGDCHDQILTCKNRGVLSINRKFLSVRKMTKIQKNI